MSAHTGVALGQGADESQCINVPASHLVGGIFGGGAILYAFWEILSSDDTPLY